MFAITVTEALVFLIIVAAIFAGLWWIFSSRPNSGLSEEEQYIEQLNHQWAAQRHEDARRAHQIRAESQQRLPNSGSTTPTASAQDPTSSPAGSAMPQDPTAGPPLGEPIIKRIPGSPKW